MLQNIGVIIGCYIINFLSNDKHLKIILKTLKIIDIPIANLYIDLFTVQ